MGPWCCKDSRQLRMGQRKTVILPRKTNENVVMKHVGLLDLSVQSQFIWKSKRKSRLSWFERQFGWRWQIWGIYHHNRSKFKVKSDVLAQLTPSRFCQAMASLLKMLTWAVLAIATVFIAHDNVASAKTSNETTASCDHSPQRQYWQRAHD